MRRTVLLMILLTLACAPSAVADRPRAARIPDDAIAYWRLDPTRFAAARADPAIKAQRDLIVAGLRAAVASGVINDPDAAKALEGLLAASEVGGRPHTLCLIGLDAERAEDGTGMAPRTLQMVLDLDSPANHRAMLRTIKAILIGDGRHAGENLNNATQREIELPGGRRAVVYRERDWAPWREIAWTSTEHSFVVGLGRGALDRWFEARDRPADQNWTPVWSAHRRFVDDQRPSGDVFFEAYLGIDGLRQGFPDAFIEGRVRRMLDTLSLSNARDVMLHGRWIDTPAADHPPLIALDATWTARSERPDQVRGVRISEDAWPRDKLAMAPPPGSYIVVMEADWERWVRVALDLVPAASKTSSSFRRRILIRNWLRVHERTLDNFLGRFERWLVISDVPTPVTPMPGAATLFAELRRGQRADDAARELAELLSPHRESINIFDGVWSFRVDPAGLLRIPSWGYTGPRIKPVMVGGWGPPVVTENRKRMGDPRAK